MHAVGSDRLGIRANGVWCTHVQPGVHGVHVHGVHYMAYMYVVYMYVVYMYIMYMYMLYARTA